MPTQPKTVKVYVAARRLKMAPGVFREPEEKKTGQAGQLVPEAHLWTRHESWLHTGHLRLKEVTPKELTAAFDEFGVPQEDRAEIRRLVGLGTALRGPHATPGAARRSRAVPAPAPTVKIGTLSGPVPPRPDRAPRSAAPAALDPEVNKEPPAEKQITRKSGGHPSTAIKIPMRALNDDPSPDGAPKVDDDVNLTGESVL